jgi:hypothetical protein
VDPDLGVGVSGVALGVAAGLRGQPDAAETVVADGGRVPVLLAVVEAEPVPVDPVCVALPAGVAGGSPAEGRDAERRCRAL